MLLLRTPFHHRPPILSPPPHPRSRHRPRGPVTTFSLLPSTLPSLLSSASVLTAIVLVHESGHFLAASLRNIRVSNFSLGFGPVLFSSGLFSLRAFPLGGFVAFPDPSDPDSDPSDPDLLRNRPVSDRIAVISAGVVANAVFAYLIVFVQVVAVGLPVSEVFPGVKVPVVNDGSPAAVSGIVAGDVVRRVDAGDGVGVLDSPSVGDLVKVIKKNTNKKMIFSIQRKEDSVLVNVVPDGNGRIGVQLSPNYKISKVKPHDLIEAFVFAGREFWGLTSTVIDGLKQTVLDFSNTAEKVSGPVAIIAIGAEVARSSSDGLYQFAAILNINLAVINLLPLPALDGGSLALVLLEAARGGRKIPKEVEERIMSSGVTVVLFLGLFLIVRDTLNLEFVKELL